MHQFHKFTLSWNSTCFGQFVCTSSGVYSLHTQQWYMWYRYVNSFRAGPGWNSWVPTWSCSRAVYKPVWHTPLLSVQWINSWWWTVELSETCRVSWQSKFVKLVHLVGFITKKFVTMHGHMNVKKRSFRLVINGFYLSFHRKLTNVLRHNVTSLITVNEFLIRNS